MPQTSPLPSLYTITPSALGELLLVSDGEALTGIYLRWEEEYLHSRRLDNALPLFQNTMAQLNAYFASQLQEFNLPLNPSGTVFQRRVWDALLTIPYGTTRTYGEIAAEIGQPSASRAVGLANSKNPISIVIPCHRVIGATGKLTGYSGGIGNKKTLLMLEAECQKA